MSNFYKNSLLVLKKYNEYITVVKFYSRSTIQIYHDVADEFIAFLRKNKVSCLKHISKEIVEKYLATFFTSEYSIATINLKISSINNFLDYLQMNNILFSKIKVKSIKRYEKYNNNTISQDKLLYALNKKSPDKHNWIYKRDYALGFLIYSTGLRVSEVVEMTTSFLYKDSWIFVNGKGGVERIVPINSRALHYIDVYKQNCPYKFTKYLWFKSNGNKITKAAIQNGIKRIFGVYPHTLRHCFATHLIENGCDINLVKEFLGHSSLHTTQNYIHISKNSLVETMMLHPIANFDNLTKN